MTRQLRPEVIHSYGFYTNFAVAYAAWATKTLAIGSRRSEYNPRKRRRGGVKRLLNAKWPAFHIVNSTPSADAAYCALSLFTSRHVVTVRNALDLNQFTCMSEASEKRRYVAAIGSLNGDVTGALGEGGFWTIKLSPSGDVLWKRNCGGSDNDHLRFMVRNPVRNEYYLAGDAESGDGDFNNTQGDADFAVIKLKLPEILSRDSAVCNINSFTPFQATIPDICGYDSAFVRYNPVPLSGPFDSIRTSDTIFIGQSVTLHANGNGTITWNSHSTLSCTNCTDPVATSQATTIYTATNRSPAHLVSLAVRMATGGMFPGWWLLAAPLAEALLWPLVTLALLAPQRRPPDPDQNCPL